MELLQDLAPVSQGYASLPVPDAFNWQDATVELGDGEWYLVAFRSIRRADADEERLNRFDELAHQEAATSPGFVHYFKGPRAADGSCLSFCLWQSRADARAAAGQPDHVRAVSLIDEMYATYTLEFHRVAREAGGPLTFAPYDAAPVHGAPVVGAAPAASEVPLALLPTRRAIPI
ncbi:MAG TPA: hypothetical protein VK194_03530 [Candidatus Deferrimicrobium sp.]|nr:hypothetical protein [Candidatus Deferrimicrobium sp.]